MIWENVTSLTDSGDRRVISEDDRREGSYMIGVKATHLFHRKNLSLHDLFWKSAASERPSIRAHVFRWVVFTNSFITSLRQQWYHSV